MVDRSERKTEEDVLFQFDFDFIAKNPRAQKLTRRKTSGWSDTSGAARALQPRTEVVGVGKARWIAASRRYYVKVD